MALLVQPADDNVLKMSPGSLGPRLRAGGPLPFPEDTELLFRRNGAGLHTKSSAEEGGGSDALGWSGKAALRAVELVPRRCWKGQL